MWSQPGLSHGPAEPHGPGAFPRLRTRGVGFSQPGCLCRLPCDAIPAAFTSVGGAGGLWDPSGAPSLPVGSSWEARPGGASLRQFGRAPWRCRRMMSPAHLRLSSTPPAICAGRERHRGRDQGSAAAPSCPRQLQAGARPHSPPSLCNLSRVPGGQAGGLGQSRTHTRRGENPGQKRLASPRERPAEQEAPRAARCCPRAPEYQRFQP